MNDTHKFNPFSTFLLGMTAFSLLVAIFAAALVGVYIHSADVARTTALQSQLNSAKGECRALVALQSADDSVKLPDINKAHPSEELLSRQTAGIDKVVEASHCKELLNGTYKPPGS